MLTPLVIEAAISPVDQAAPSRTVAELAADAAACVAAGATIVHSHHDGRLDAEGSVAQLAEVWGPLVAEHPGVRCYPGFVRAAGIAAKTAHLRPLADAGLLGLVPLDPGSVTIGEVDDDGVPAYSSQYVNSYDDANHVVGLAGALGLGVTVGVFEPGFLRVALAYERAGLLVAGSMVKLYFGGDASIYHPGRRALNFGLPPTRAALDAYLEMLGPSGLAWSVRLSGGDLLGTPVARLAVERGGHLRVGVEDEAGVTGATNVELVQAAVALADRVGRPVARVGAPSGTRR